MKSIIGYQIYLRSFNDSNGDNIGDLNGVSLKIEYLKKLGINTIWLSPFNKSPMLDNGYDISEYYLVDEIFGNLDDLKSLIHLCHINNIRVIMDLVLNHCSSEHEWFKKAISEPKSKYFDYFIFREEKNNWGSFFGDSTWTYVPKLNKYYFHTFGSYMPDFNWENKDLRADLYKIANFYLDLGIDGFRLDAISHLAKDLSFKDSDKDVNEDGWVCDDRKFSNLPRLFDFLDELKTLVFDKRECLTIGEVGGSCNYKTLNKFLKYIDYAFTFDHNWHNGFSIDNLEKEINLISLKSVFNQNYQNSISENNKLISYWLNHDHPRLLQHYGNLDYPMRSAACLASFLILFKGSFFIYNGEEIGMVNVDYDEYDKFNDVSAINFIKENKDKMKKEDIINYLQNTNRSNARSKMMWNEDFSSNNKFKKNNVFDEDKDRYSILNYYRELIRYRKTNLEFFNDADFRFIDLGSNKSLSYIRKTNYKTVINIINFSNEIVDYDKKIDLKNFKIIKSNYQESSDKLRPYENIIFEGEMNESYK